MATIFKKEKCKRSSSINFTAFLLVLLSFCTQLRCCQSKKIVLLAASANAGGLAIENMLDDYLQLAQSEGTTTSPSPEPVAAWTFHETFFSKLLYDPSNQQDETFRQILNVYEAAERGIILGAEELEQPSNVLPVLIALDQYLNDNLSQRQERVVLEIVFTYKTPRVSQWWTSLSKLWRNKGFGGLTPESYKNHLCDAENTDLLLFEIEHDMNVLGNTLAYMEAGYDVTMIDIEAVQMSGKDLGHVFACDILELNCHENGTVVGLESEIYSPRVINAPSLVKSVHENSFRDRDCGFQVSLEESRHFLNILYGPGLFGHCDTEPSSQEVYRKFAESPALVLDDIRWKSNCPASSLIDSDVRTTTDNGVLEETRGKRNDGGEKDTDGSTSSRDEPDHGISDAEEEILKGVEGQKVLVTAISVVGGIILVIILYMLYSAFGGNQSSGYHEDDLPPAVNDAEDFMKQMEAERQLMQGQLQRPTIT